MSFRFLKKHHIRRSAEFQTVYARRQRCGDDVLLVYGCENGLDHSRLGLSVSRKVGNAVVRNRWKRLIREAFRHAQEELPEGVDYVVIPNKTAEPSLEPIRDSLCSLANRIQRKLTRSRA